MSDFDLDLVAALAAGTIPAGESAALEAALAANPAAAAELAAQRRALAAIRTATEPRLGEDERTTLRAAIAARVGLTPDVAPTPTRRRTPWGAIAVAASTIVAVVALAPVVGMIGDRDEDAMTVADANREADLESATTTDAANAPGGDNALPTTMAPASAGETSDTTTMAPFSDGTGGEIAAPVAQDLALLADDPEAVSLIEMPVEPDTACRPEAEGYLGGTDLTYFSYPMSDEDGATIEYVVFHLAAPDGTPGMLVAFDPADCSMPIAVP